MLYVQQNTSERNAKTMINMTIKKKIITLYQLSSTQLLVDFALCTSGCLGEPNESLINKEWGTKKIRQLFRVKSREREWSTGEQKPFRRRWRKDMQPLSCISYTNLSIVLGILWQWPCFHACFSSLTWTICRWFAEQKVKT